MPIVSVIIPTYNRTESVAAAIKSLLNQSFIDFELIVVDDGSTDGTTEALSKQFGSKIQLIHLENNRGVSAARNTGAAAANGRYLSFLDSDDVWHPDKLKVQIDFHHENPRFLLSQTEEIWIRHGRRVNPHNKHKKPSGYIFPHSLHLCTVSPSSVMLEKTLFDKAGGFDERLTACEDYDLWLRITPEHPVALIERRLLTKYGGHSDQLSRRYPAMDRFRLYSLGKIILSGKLDKTQQEQAQKVMAEKLTVLVAGARKRGRNTSDLEILVTAALEKRISRDEFLLSGSELLLDDKLFAEQ